MSNQQLVLSIPQDAIETHQLAGVLGAPLEAGEKMYQDLQYKYSRKGKLKIHSLQCKTYLYIHAFIDMLAVPIRNPQNGIGTERSVPFRMPISQNGIVCRTCRG